MNTLNISVVSLSASDESVSRVCAKKLVELLDVQKVKTQFIDVCSLPPVWVKSGGLASLPKEYQQTEAMLKATDAVVLAYPIYCYTASSVAKAFTEIFSGCFTKMPVGTIVAAGSLRSHLATGDLMLSMMHEQNTICYPKTVLATRNDLTDAGMSTELQERLLSFSLDFARFAAALRDYREQK